MNIEQLLRDYKENKSRYKLLEVELRQIEKQFRQIPDGVKYLNGPVIADTPFSITNKFKSITEDAAIKSVEYYQEISKRSAEIVFQLEDLRNDIDTTEALFELLGEQEQFIINSFYFLKLQWRVIVIEYQKKYQNLIERDALRTIKRKALSRMEELFVSVS